MINSNSFLGLTNVEKFKFGVSDVKVYMGDVLIYPLSKAITYEASIKLVETSSTGDTIGLHVNSFSGANGQQLILTEHIFENGVGTITFDDDVVEIGDYAFYGCANMTKFDIPNTVITIDDSAFSGCTNITTMTIPKNVTIIGDNVFDNCNSLTSVTMESAIPPTLGSDTFDNTNNCLIIVPCGSEDSYRMATNWSNYSSRIKPSPIVTSVSLNTNSIVLNSETVATHLLETVLPGNACIKTVKWSSDNNDVAVVTSDGIVLAIETGTTNIRVTTDDGGYTSICAVNVTSKSNNVIVYTAPSKLSETTTTSSGQPGVHINSFSGTNGQQLTIVSHTFENGIGIITFDDNVETIGSYAFFKCSGMTSISLPNTITAIKNDAFSVCESLEYINIPEGVTNISYSIFQLCGSLKEVKIPDSVTTIGDSAFAICQNLTDVIIGSGVTSIGSQAFQQCYNLSSVTLGDSVETIGDMAFYSATSLTSIEIPDSVTAISENTFDYCESLSSCTIGSGVTSIGNRAFRACNSLTTLDIPDSVTIIGDNAFYGCDNLSSVTIGSGITYIGYYSFTNNPNLTRVYIKAETAPDGSSTAFDYNITNIYVNCSALESYITKWNYSRLMGVGCPFVVAKFNVTSTVNPTKIINNLNNRSICYVEIDGSTIIERVDLTTGYTFSTTGEHIVKYSIGLNNLYSNIFNGCTNLTSITIPDSITSIGDYALQGCSSLTSIDMPSGVTSIGNQAFYNCSSLTSIDMPSGVTSIGQYAFAYCSGLTSIASNATTAPSIQSSTFRDVMTGGTLTVPIGSTGYDVWMGIGDYYLGKYNWTKVEQKDYLTFIATESGTFKFSGNSINYSLDSGKTWTALASDTNTPTVESGHTIMWKASGLTPTSSNGIGRFSSTSNFTVEGNVMSLCYGDDFVGQKDLTGNDYEFFRLFSGCTGMTSAINLSLPATTLAESCYRNMFKGCTSLTTAPELPATTLADYCYEQMFHSCTSLTTAPELPATTLADSCYKNIFNGCTSLTTAPELPATTLADSCYKNIFNGCTSLTTAPELPVTTLANNCYEQMFKRCVSLTTAPELPATTLATSAYTRMFQSCTNLNEITCFATDISATDCTLDWVSGVTTSNGTFTKTASMTDWTTGNNGIPNGWTVQDA